MLFELWTCSVCGLNVFTIILCVMFFAHWAPCMVKKIKRFETIHYEVMHWRQYVCISIGLLHIYYWHVVFILYLSTVVNCSSNLRRIRLTYWYSDQFPFKSVAQLILFGKYWILFLLFFVSVLGNYWHILCAIHVFSLK